MTDRHVYIVDDDEAVRESLAALLESHGYEIATFASARDFLEACPADAVGCLLTDVRMPDIDGLELQQRAAERFPRLLVVTMTGHADVPIAVRAMKAGAIDFVEKPFTEEQILATLGDALAQSTRAQRATSPNTEVVDRLDQLSGREREVLQGLVNGMPNKTIAYDLGISPRTVEIHRARVMEKMAARSLSELVRLALSAGILPR